jgi:hypothetical protein
MQPEKLLKKIGWKMRFKFRLLRWWHGWGTQRYRIGINSSPFSIECTDTVYYLVYNSKRLLELSAEDYPNPNHPTSHNLAYQISRIAYQKFGLKLAPDFNDLPME